jgi:hypothetical protein
MTYSSIVELNQNNCRRKNCQTSQIQQYKVYEKYIFLQLKYTLDLFAGALHIPVWLYPTATILKYHVCVNQKTFYHGNKTVEICQGTEILKNPN